jgi:hypothetical protein
MKKRVLVTFVVFALAVPVLVSEAGAGAPVKFRWHIANAFLQTATEIPQTGARARADDGDLVTVTGRGRFNSSTGGAAGGGAFLHTTAAGAVVGFGTWTATGVRDFELFGCGVSADGAELPPDFCGGVLTLDVRLRGINLAAGAATLDGVLVVTCLVGDSPEDIPAGAEEGITLDVPGAITFGDLVSEDGGLTVFVSRG